MVVSLKKSDADAGEAPYLSLVPTAKPTVVAERVVSEAAVESAPADHAVADEESPDRALRHRLILGNVIAWLVIIVAIRLIFF